MKSLIILIVTTAFSIAAVCQSVGTKVTLVGTDGKNYTGSITKIQGGKYLVKYDGFNYTSWLSKNQFSVTTANVNTNQKKASSLHLGEYATYGYGGGAHIIAGMGFILLQGGGYYDLEHQRGGKYVHNAAKGTVSFQGGFLDGQVGKKDGTGFWLSETVFCEPF